jgi:ribosomal protein S18 acetylase RimI-like enzyme
MHTPTITLRSVTADDRELLFRIYASAREDELAVVPFSAQEKNAFLRMQFAARERTFGERFSTGDQLMIERDGEAIGSLWVHRHDSELRVLDVALLPEHRGAGVGTHLMSSLIREARSRGVPLRLSVLSRGTAARRFYERLGFTAVGKPSVYQSMELVP